MTHPCPAQPTHMGNLRRLLLEDLGSQEPPPLPKPASPQPHRPRTATLPTIPHDPPREGDWGPQAGALSTFMKKQLQWEKIWVGCAPLISSFHAQHLFCETTGSLTLYKTINLSSMRHNSIHLLWRDGLFTHEWYSRAIRSDDQPVLSIAKFQYPPYFSQLFPPPSQSRKESSTALCSGPKGAVVQQSWEEWNKDHVGRSLLLKYF